MKVDKDVRPESLANKIVNTLFRAGDGTYGHRLAIMHYHGDSMDETSISGWCVESARTVIADILRAEFLSKRK